MIKKYGISFRKLSIILLILVVLGYIVAAITVISRFIDQTCAYQKLPEVISLDGTYTVKVTDMTCPTTQFRTDVQIFKLKNKSIIPLLNKSDVFAFNGVVYNVDVTWLDNNTLKIVYRNCERISKQNTKWNEINIVYDNQCKNED